MGTCAYIVLPFRFSDIFQRDEQVRTKVTTVDYLMYFLFFLFFLSTTILSVVYINYVLLNRFIGNLGENDSLLCLYQHLSQKRLSFLDVSCPEF